MISRLELKRNLFHMVLGVAFLLLLHFDILGFEIFTVLLFIGAITYIVNLSMPLPVIGWFINAFEREEDKRKTPGKGAMLLVSGAYLAFLIYPKDIALASIAILTFGDSVAPLVGHLGRIRHPLARDTKKLLEGNIAGMLAGFIAAMTFVKPLEAFIASFIAMTVETIEIRIHPKLDKVNDNILIPLVAGAVIWGMRLAF
ncbi:hypothetical protein JXA85_04010 [Candidatus Woesearchaeota archaeon]|nr:hypothetical protein [Candidatus Woesearchaeota archaeon]